MNTQQRVIHTLSFIPHVGAGNTLRLLTGLLHKQQPSSFPTFDASDEASDIKALSWDRVLKHFDTLDIESLLSLSEAELHQLRVPLRVAQSITQYKQYEEKALRDYDAAYQKHAHIITITDSRYPPHLRHIPQPPLVLYVMGDPSILSQKAIAFVGSRDANRYGQMITDSLVRPLAAAGWVIVSGGALGADAMAHQAALSVAGKSVAVLGSGLNFLMPTSNSHIFDALIDHSGAVISHFPMHTRPDKTNYPDRNRIISGLSLGTVVIQAAERSGALITAHHALEQGRGVFAVPGPVDDPLSVGCHDLIRQGGTLVYNWQQIELELMEPAGGVPQQMTIFGTQPNKNTVQEVEQHPLLAHLAAPATLDELALSTGHDFDMLQQMLFALQLEGVVKQDFTGSWQRA